MSTRNLLAEIIDEHGDDTNEIVAAILDDPRIAVVALPKFDQPTERGVRWSGGDNDYAVYANPGLVQTAGAVYNLVEGDDPTPFAAALLAAARYAAKQVAR